MIRSHRLSLMAAVAVCTVAQPRRALPAEPEPERGTPSALGPAADPPRPEARADEHPPRSEGRELAGHVFMPSVSVIGPFATTSFASFMALGGGSTEGSLTLQLPGNPLPPPQTFRGSVSYAAVGGLIGFEYAFLPGVSARVGISQTIYSGTTGASAAVVGSNVRIGGSAGLTAGIKIGRSARIAAVFDANYAPRLGLVIGPAIQSTFAACSQGVASCRFDFDDLFQQRNVLILQPGIAASWAPTRALGFTANVSYVYTSIGVSGQDAVREGGIAPGAVIDFDFMGISKVPLGLQLTWSSLIAFSDNVLTTGYTDLGGGIFYTGRRELSLGIQVVDRRFRVAEDVDVSWVNIVGFIGLRYYW